MENLSREWLDYYADQIELIFQAHHLDAGVSGVQVSPRWVRFILSLGYGTKITSIQNLAEEIAVALDSPDVRVTRGTANVAVEVQRGQAEPVRLLALLDEIPVLPPVTAIPGLGMEGETYMLPLMAPEVTHVLISGATGSGKTELLRSLLLSLALYNRPAQLQMLLIDPKRRGFSPLAALPHLAAPPATHDDEAEMLLDFAVQEMERRDHEGLPPTPRLIVAVDEVGDLLSTGGKRIEKLLVRLAQRGREAGFHLLLSTQRPSAEAVPSAVKANLPARLIGKVASAQEALTAAGISGTGAETLYGSGDFLAVIGGRVSRFQAAYCGPVDIESICARLNRPEPAVVGIQPGDQAARLAH